VSLFSWLDAELANTGNKAIVICKRQTPTANGSRVTEWQEQHPL
jgi:hypothetical protein